MNPAAQEQFVEMIQHCGSSIYRMQSSCEMYLNQYLSAFPEEQQVLRTALRCGVPDAIMRFRSRKSYTDFIERLKERFASDSQLPEESVRWAIESWALALGRPVDSFVLDPVTDARAGRVYPEDDEPDESTVAIARTAMMAIVGSGGFLGGLLAVMLIPCFLWAADFGFLFGQDHAASGSKQAIKSELMVFLIFGLLGIGVGVMGAAAAVFAWWYAGGDQKPWATFSVAFGTAFVMVWITGFVPLIILPAKPIVFFIAVFSSVYKSAARGGMY